MVAIRHPWSQDPGAKVDKVFELWLRLEAGLNIQVENIQAKEAKLRSSKVGGLDGCGWYKCALRGPGAEPEREMMLCSRCKAVSRLIHCPPQG